jgi:exonuclease V gamma subunit
MLIHSNHPEQLRDLLVAWVQRYPLAPLETETILVQSNGVTQWLRTALAADMRPDQSGGCGIAAGVEFVMPAPFLWQVYRAVLGHQQVEPTSYFEKSHPPKLQGSPRSFMYPLPIQGLWLVCLRLLPVKDVISIPDLSP